MRLSASVVVRESPTPTAAAKVPCPACLLRVRKDRTVLLKVMLPELMPLLAVDHSRCERTTVLRFGGRDRSADRRRLADREVLDVITCSDQAFVRPVRVRFFCACCAIAFRWSERSLSVVRTQGYCIREWVVVGDCSPRWFHRWHPSRAYGRRRPAHHAAKRRLRWYSEVKHH